MPRLSRLLVALALLLAGVAGCREEGEEKAEKKEGKKPEAGARAPLKGEARELQERALQRIVQRANGKFWVRPGTLDEVYRVSLPLPTSGVTGFSLSLLERLPHLESLTVDSAYVTDRELKELGQLKGLKSLSLANARITDAGLEYLTGLTKLEELNLSGSSINGSGLTFAAKWPRLKRLDLTATLCTDDSLKHLQGLRGLEALSLGRRFGPPEPPPESGLTDAGLAHLKKVPSLRALNLHPAKYTNAGIKDLQDARPKLEINKRYRVKGEDF